MAKYFKVKNDVELEKYDEKTDVILDEPAHSSHKIILYFRGFPRKKPQGSSSKLRQLRHEYTNTDFGELFIDDMSIEYLSTLKDQIQHYETVVLIGESMGCLSAMYLRTIISNRYIVLALLNPSYYPEETLKSALTDEEMQATLSIKEKIESVNNIDYKIYLYQCQDDDRVDYKRFNKTWEKHIANALLLEVGGHQMSSFSVITDNWVYLFFGQYMSEEDWEIDPSYILNEVIRGEYYNTTIITKEEIETNKTN